jgi:type IV pilus assembly protein PilX
MTAIHQQPNVAQALPSAVVAKCAYRQTRSIGRHRRQHGAVLVVGLIILVMLTLLGVQALRSNLAQERMAFNVRERNAAFQAAEAALRVGEGLNPFPASSAALPDPLNWGAEERTGQVPTFDAGLIEDPMYHVGPPHYVRVGLSLPPEWRLIYPVTSRGVGGQAGSVVVLQSGFEPLQ